MVNQDPQPELYTTRHQFNATNVTGDVSTVTIYTNQANNEECRIYAVLVDILNENGTPASTTTTDVDFGISIQVGPNNIPTNEFDATVICFRDDKQLAFPSPILALFQQPLAVQVSLNSTTGATLAANRTVVITLVSELAIQRRVPPSNLQFRNPSYKR
jgi:hypothetical protein|tara:strand:- start:372 stop:848 length:477 start_codon:yes stop_codon:yes gene_type:complete